MLVWRSLRVFLQVDELSVREELAVRMMLINAVSMPNDVSRATY